MRLLCLLLIILASGCASIEAKYSKSSTVELKLKRQQLIDAMAMSGQQINIRFGGMIQPGNPNEDRIKQKDEIERELLRRWKTGDKEAYLQIFGN